MNNRRYVKKLLLGSMFVAPAIAHADSWLDDTYVAPMFSYSIADDSRNTKDGLGGTLGAGWRLGSAAEVELIGTYLKFKGDGSSPCGLLGLAQCKNDDQHIGGGGIGANLFLNTETFGGPFLHADVMYTNETKALYRAGPGWDFNFGDSGWALRAEALLQRGDYTEPVFNIGLRIPLGPHRLPFVPPVAEPVQVVAAPPLPPPPPPRCELPADASSAVDFSGCKTGDTIVLRGVNFEFDKWNLTPNAKALLDPVAAALVARPDIKVEIDGHTDSKGSDAYNMKLSDHRAKSVKDYLIKQGVAADRLGSKGFGESMPIADNQTDDGRALNRRVELKVIEAGAGAVTVEQAGKTDETFTAPPAPAEAMPPPPPAAAMPPPPAAAMPPPPAPAAAPAGGDGFAAPPIGAEPPPAAPMAHDGMAMPAATAAPSTAAAASGSGAVSIENFAFTPATLTVTPGTTVTFTNNDGSNHIVAFADGDKSPRLKQGASWTKTFSAPGEFAYTCAIHASMTGTVIVK